MALEGSTVQLLLGSGDVVVPSRQPTLYSSAILTSANGTTPVALFTGAPYYFITRLLVSFDPNCTVTTPGIVAINFTDSVYGLLGSARVWCPQTFNSPTMSTPSTIVESGAGYFFHSSSANSTLSISLSTTLAGGAIRAAVNYGLTTNAIG